MTVYANLVDGEIKGVYDLLPKTWNENENFDLKCKVDEDFMRVNEFVKIIRNTTPFDPTTHKMSDSLLYTVENGEVYEHRDIIEIPQPSIVEETPPTEEQPTQQV